jgi:hypothetical protein
MVLEVPVPGNSWRTYGVNWVGLDAPRHLHIVTPEGMRRLAEALGCAWPTGISCPRACTCGQRTVCR